MRSAVEIRPLQAGDVEAVAARMRVADQAECRALGHEPLEALQASVLASAVTWVAEVEGAPAAIFGVAPAGTMLDPRGLPWLLGTDAVPANRRALVRLTGPYIRRMLGLFPHLVNAVHARNTHAVRWLKRAGFTMHPAVEVAGGEMFHPFEMKA